MRHNNDSLKNITDVTEEVALRLQSNLIEITILDVTCNKPPTKGPWTPPGNYTMKYPLSQNSKILADQRLLGLLSNASKRLSLVLFIYCFIIIIITCIKIKVCI